MQFKTGDEATFHFVIEGGIDVTGCTPRAVISQDNLTIELEHEGSSGMLSVFKLPSSSSACLVSGIRTVVQESWEDGSGNRLVFPEHEVTVVEQFVPIFPNTDIDTEGAIWDDPDIDVEDDEFSDDGGLVEEYDPLEDEPDESVIGEDGDIEEPDPEEEG